MFIRLRHERNVAQVYYSDSDGRYVFCYVKLPSSGCVYRKCDKASCMSVALHTVIHD